MLSVNVTDISLLKNPAPFNEPFEFEIRFHVMNLLTQDLEWRLVYVGSADSNEHDQVLDSVLVGPLQVGLNAFVFSAPPPNIAKIPAEDLLGATIVMLVASYKGADFFKAGYYVVNEMPGQSEGGQEVKFSADKATRNVVINQPKVSKFEINWD